MCRALLWSLALVWGSCLVVEGRAEGRDDARYTADRPADFLHMRLALEFTQDGLLERRCKGRVEYRLRPRGKDLSFVQLNAVEMEIQGVTVGAGDEQVSYSYDDDLLTIRFSSVLRMGEEMRLVVDYRLDDPSQGMYFVLPSASVPEKPLMVYTMSEPLEARYWFPTHDWPNERWVSDIYVTVPEIYTVVANGVLVEKVVLDGRARFHWRNTIPTDPHLVGLVLGELVELRDEWRGRPVMTYTQKGQEEAAKCTFRRVPEMMEFYTKVIGIDFPYPGYSHITVVDHHHGGMEHAGFSFVRPRFMARSEDGEWWMERTQTHYLAHMLGHMWFAGMVNYRSVSEAWLNEGFASHLHELWLTHTDADPEARFQYDFWLMARKIARFDSTEKGRPLVDRHLDELGDIYTNDGGKLYDKGSWVVNMLRQSMGDDLFWGAVGKYLEHHKWGSVETADLRQVLEEESGRDLEQFFQQWVHGRGIPRLKVDYGWEPGARRVSVSVRQTQPVDGEMPAFTFPLELTFVVGGEERQKEVWVREALETFTFEFPQEPSQFWVDPRGRVLKEVTVDMPLKMKLRQVRRGGTVVSRLMGVRSLARHGRARAVKVLGGVIADKEEFWGVRAAAAEMLGEMGVDAAESALLGVVDRVAGESRVLASVLRALGAYTASREAHEVLLKYSGADQALEVERATVVALGRMKGATELAERARKRLEEASVKPTRRWVRVAALKSLGSMGGEASYETVLRLTQPAKGEELRNEAIRALGSMGRADELRGRIREKLVGWLVDPDRGAQAAAIEALGKLGDAEAIPELERIQKSAKDVHLRAAAEDAVRAIEGSGPR